MFWSLKIFKKTFKSLTHLEWILWYAGWGMDRDLFIFRWLIEQPSFWIVNLFLTDLKYLPYYLDFPGGSDDKESACNVGDLGCILGVRKIPWRREWQPTPVFLPGESHGQKSLVDNSPWGHKSQTRWVTKHTHKRLVIYCYLTFLGRLLGFILGSIHLLPVSHNFNYWGFLR